MTLGYAYLDDHHMEEAAQHGGLFVAAIAGT